MDDDQILERGGDERDIEEYAKQNGADLTEKDFTPTNSVRSEIEALDVEFLHGVPVRLPKATVDQLEALFIKREDMARDKYGLIERRQEVYQLWVWSTEAYSKGLVSRTHQAYINKLYRRYNDLTDQLQELTGETRYVHYDIDRDTLKPLDILTKTNSKEKL